MNSIPPAHKLAALPLLFLLTAGTSFAQDSDIDTQVAQDLARANACLTCHSIDNTIVGPAYIDIAEKYRGDDSALESLVAKVLNGGGGNWGSYPMPANAHIPEEKVQTIVAWILSLEKD